MATFCNTLLKQENENLSSNYKAHKQIYFTIATGCVVLSKWNGVDSV